MERISKKTKKGKPKSRMHNKSAYAAQNNLKHIAQNNPAHVAQRKSSSADAIYDYGYDDPAVVLNKPSRMGLGKILGFALAIIFIIGVWLALDYKLLAGDEWISPTYDNPDWRTNEGNLHTNGAWDFEAHVWKTEYIMENFPNFQWNPYWYMGMPLIKYYQPGFYIAHALTIVLTGLSAPRAALMLVVFGHLVAAIVTFMLAYKLSRRIWIAALSSAFIFLNTFISLRSYGWEPITVVFLFIYPLIMLIFLKRPLEPFRLPIILLLALAYISHPLIWLPSCISMGIYLFSIALRKNVTDAANKKHYILEFGAVVVLSLMLSAFQFLPQFTYDQVTSGAHMGVKYLPYYHIPFNIITFTDFLFDAGNLKGPGAVVMIALLVLAAFFIMHHLVKKRSARAQRDNSSHSTAVQATTLLKNPLVSGLALILLITIAFYYMELYSIFPMNVLQSTQYHRVIPEMIIMACITIAAAYNFADTRAKKAVFHLTLVVFLLASSVVLYNVQAQWDTSSTIRNKPEFIYDEINGRISFPYTDQSLSVRNSFTKIPQVYGYYEQGVTNPYTDEMFSVSSGFHNANLTMMYLKAANVARLYVNIEEGERDNTTMHRFNNTLPRIATENARYAYYEIPLHDPSFVQAVDIRHVDELQQESPRCRTLFKEEYCGSSREEFVARDAEEIRYLRGYVELLEMRYDARASIEQQNPEKYIIEVYDATEDTAVIVKMTYDKDFKATIDGNKVPISPIGPDFMLMHPARSGDYTIMLEYTTSRYIIAGIIISVMTFIGLILLFTVYRSHVRHGRIFSARFKQGDMGKKELKKR